MSDVEKQQELYTRMCAVHRDMLQIIKDYEEWQSPGDVVVLQSATLEFGRIALNFGSEIVTE